MDRNLERVPEREQSISSETSANSARTSSGLPVIVHDLFFSDVKLQPSQVHELSQLKPWKSSVAILLNWSVIFAAACLSLQMASWPLWGILVLIIASRQHALLVLMHDGAHFRLFRNRRWNDRLSNWFLAYPLIVTTEGYRCDHLAHHAHLNTGKDPDWVRKKECPDWRFPKSIRALSLILIKDIFGGGLMDNLRAVRRLSKNIEASAERRPAKTLSSRPFYYVALLLTLFFTSNVWSFFALWIFPAFTILPAIIRIQSIAEHFGLKGNNDLNMSRNYGGSIWERFLLTPHNTNFHLDHHLYPSVPFYNLPKLHQLLMGINIYRHRAHQNERLFGSSRTSVLSDIT